MHRAERASWLHVALKARAFEAITVLTDSGLTQTLLLDHVRADGPWVPQSTVRVIDHIEGLLLKAARACVDLRIDKLTLARHREDRLIVSAIDGRRLNYFQTG